MPQDPLLARVRRSGYSGARPLRHVSLRQGIQNVVVGRERVARLERGLDDGGRGLGVREPQGQDGNGSRARALGRRDEVPVLGAAGRPRRERPEGRGVARLAALLEQSVEARAAVVALVDGGGAAREGRPALAPEARPVARPALRRRRGLSGDRVPAVPRVFRKGGLLIRIILDVLARLRRRRGPLGRLRGRPRAVLWRRRARDGLELPREGHGRGARRRPGRAVRLWRRRPRFGLDQPRSVLGARERRERRAPLHPRKLLRAEPQRPLHGHAGGRVGARDGAARGGPVPEIVAARVVAPVEALLHRARRPVARRRPPPPLLVAPAGRAEGASHGCRGSPGSPLRRCVLPLRLSRAPR